MAVECVNGNFYVRNSRFENNGLDVFANPEHSSSIRRSVSVGSGAFLHFQNGVSPFTVENCLVVDWKNDVAIKAGGAPLLAFDNRFVSSAQKTAAIEAKRDQHVVHTANTVEGVTRLFLHDSATYVTAALAEKSPLHLRADMQVMPATVELPSRRFDARTDFGAIGDGKADDTAALQAAIDAARAHGNNAMAYIPKGSYRLTRSLRLEGSGYSFGGGTVYSELHFDGDKDADAIVVAPGGDLTLDTFRVRRTAVKIIREARDEGWRVRTSRIGEFDGKGADIRQLPSANGSRVLYHTVYVSGKYIEMPFALGMQFDGLREHDSVILHNIEGNLQFANSGDATILHTVGYEGTFWVHGENRKGFLGVMTRLATRSKHSIFVEDSQSFVASDFYEEQAPPEGIVLTGKKGDVPGRLTLGFVKIDRIVHVRNYVGEINLVASQFYLHRSHGNPGIDFVGEQPEVNFIASFFYVPKLVVDPTDTEINFVGSTGSSAYSSAELDGKLVHLVHKIENSITDLRKLGHVDWRLNYPGLLAQ
ncbi:MAG: glycosyl hydrolase family 28-related protein [Rariglobus sp.]